jgi:hypothetical protein
MVKINLSITQELILSCLKKQDGLTSKEIAEKTKQPIVVVSNTIKSLLKAKHIKENKTKEGVVFSYLPPPVKKEKEESTNNPKKFYMQRDRTKYELEGNGLILGKGRFVLAVVKSYIQANKPTFAQMEEQFPKSLQKGMGVFLKVVDIKKKAIEARFFMGDTEILTTADNIKIAVTREFGKSNTPLIAEHAIKKLKYKVKIHN